MPHPGKRNEKAFVPRLIAWELTRNCSMNCRHCRAAAHAGPYAGELSFDEVARTIDGIANRFSPIMILTGGEPLLRPDILDIIRYSVGKGLPTVLATCGALLDVKTARDLLDAGIQRISVSIDGPDADSHDAFRGVPGAFNDALGALDAARRAGLPFQVNTTVMRWNKDLLPDVLDLAVREGAVAFHPFLLVPTGRGREIEHEALDAEEYEATLNRIYEMRQAAPITFKPTCAPHYYRVLRQREAEAGRTVTPDTHGLDATGRGCMGGLSFAFISHTGKVQICGFLEVEAGDLRAAGMDFPSIWDGSPLFDALRNPANYKGDCGVCEYMRWCGGCRARAFAATGDYLAEEPFCAYTPPARRGTDEAG